MTPRQWWDALRSAPPPLTWRERWVFIAVSVVTAASRMLALARSPWDWDELLFMLALQRFDVARHRPHPPGFPLYIAAGKLIRALGIDDFRALQVIGTVAAVLIVPVMFFLCRELRMPFITSIIAAALLAFFPNVWIYGGTALSDVPSMTLAVLAAALLLAGCRDARMYMAGAAALAVAAGFRPQDLLVGVAPLLIASIFQWRRGALRVVAAAAITAAVIGVSYGAAAWLTGLDRYRQALHEHRAYIMSIDSFLVPSRPALWRVFDDFFVRPYHASVINTVITLLAVVSTVFAVARRRAEVLMAMLMFAPVCLITWMMLDRFSSSRFSIAYAPLLAILAADGLQLLTRRRVVEAAVGAAIVIFMVIWSWPALSVVRNEITPPIRATNWLRIHAVRGVTVIAVAKSMVPYAERYLSDYSLQLLDGDKPPVRWMERVPMFYLTEGPGAVNFTRQRGRLWDVVRRRYFETSVSPLNPTVRFEQGWYDQEGSGTNVWRWMAARSQATLPPMRGPAQLVLDLYVPLDALSKRPHVAVRINGTVVDRFQPTEAAIERDIIVRPRPDALNDLVIETDGVIEPSRDRRILGLRLNALQWNDVP